MPRILITAFEPFGGDTENASAEVLGELRALIPHAVGAFGCDVVTAVLPVVFDSTAFGAAIREHAPNAVVSLGEAGMRRIVTVERIAVNAIEARIPDNAGRQPHGRPVELHGPPTRRARLDVDAICAAIRAAGVEAEPSDDAGRYVCNATAYRAYGLDVPAVFIHLPALRRAGAATVGAETDTGRLGQTTATVGVRGAAQRGASADRPLPTHAGVAAGVLAAIGEVAGKLGRALPAHRAAPEDRD